MTIRAYYLLSACSLSETLLCERVPISLEIKYFFDPIISFSSHFLPLQCQRLCSKYQTSWLRVLHRLIGRVSD